MPVARGVLGVLEIPLPSNAKSCQWIASLLFTVFSFFWWISKGCLCEFINYITIILRDDEWRQYSALQYSTIFFFSQT